MAELKLVKDMSTYKEIHIGNKIKTIARLKKLSVSRACMFLKCSAQDIENMYLQESLDSKILLRWCKLLEYNFFMFYHSHLQLYSPSASGAKVYTEDKEVVSNYSFKKNLYSPEIIEYVLQQWNSNALSAKEIMKKYHIPRTTLYRWKKKESKTSKTSTVLKKEVDYKLLYQDFIKASVKLSSQNKKTLLHQVEAWSDYKVSYEDLYAVNKLIKNIVGASYDNVLYQRLKAYDDSFMLKIFRDQKMYNLSDLYISHKYKLSRNTIIKWKKKLEDKI